MKNFESSFDFIFSNAIMIAMEIYSGKITIRFFMVQSTSDFTKKTVMIIRAFFPARRKKRITGIPAAGPVLADRP